MNRVVALIDMDCFYCQVEEKLNPNLKDKPIAVVQYNDWKGGGIIAVNYLARARGVTRHMRGDEAKEVCPDIELPKVPCVRGKADISKYRDAGKEVAVVLQSFTPLLERASIDEAYLDITENVNARINAYKNVKQLSSEELPNTYVLGYDTVNSYINEIYDENQMEHEMGGFNSDHSLKLLVGALIIKEVREAVYENTGFRCSAGIASNKIMAKLVCGMNKPNKQTVLPENSVSNLFADLPVTKVKSLGGKFGSQICEILNISKMKELQAFTEKELQKHFDEKNGSWLYNIARGIDHDPVTPRFNAKSIGCCKKFAGKGAILDVATLEHWLNELGDEIEDRLKTDSLENSRQPTQMVVSFTKQLLNGKDVSCSRSINIPNGSIFCGKTLASKSLELIKKDSKPFSTSESNEDSADNAKIIMTHPIKFLGISVGKFEEHAESKKGKNIKHFFKANDNEDLPTKADNIPDLVNHQPKNVTSNDTQVDTKPTNALMTEKQAPKSKKQVNLTQQESFFNNYFKKAESKTVDDSDKPNEQVEKDASSLQHILPEVIVKHSELEENCSSDDSQGTIELEINKSLRMSPVKVTSAIPRSSGISHNLFSKENLENLDTGEPSNFCALCYKSIPLSERETHKDYHFALSLRNKDIESNRIKPTAILKPDTKKSPKQSTSKASIDNFFGKASENQTKNNSEENEHLVECDECGKKIPASDLMEHVDFHEAKRLHLEINKTESVETTIKRKKDVDQSSNQSKNVKMRPISSFFKK